MKKLSALLCSLALVIFVLPINTHACSCMPFESVANEYEFADAVFVGQVTNIANNSLVDDSNRKITFQRGNIWKGSAEEYVEVITANDSAACGYPFELNKQYLVYANKQEGSDDLHASICSGTKLAEEATKDIVELNNLAKVIEPEINNSSDSSLEELLNHPYTLPIFIIIVLDLIVFFYIIRKAKIKKALAQNDPIQRN